MSEQPETPAQDADPLPTIDPDFPESGRDEMRAGEPPRINLTRDHDDD